MSLSFLIPKKKRMKLISHDCFEVQTKGNGYLNPSKGHACHVILITEKIECILDSKIHKTSRNHLSHHTAPLPCCEIWQIETREVKGVVQSHAASYWQNLNLNPHFLKDSSYLDAKNKNTIPMLSLV